MGQEHDAGLSQFAARPAAVRRVASRCRRTRALDRPPNSCPGTGVRPPSSPPPRSGRASSPVSALRVGHRRRSDRPRGSGARPAKARGSRKQRVPVCRRSDAAIAVRRSVQAVMRVSWTRPIAACTSSIRQLVPKLSCSQRNPGGCSRSYTASKLLPWSLEGPHCAPQVRVGGRHHPAFAARRHDLVLAERPGAPHRPIRPPAGRRWRPRAPGRSPRSASGRVRPPARKSPPCLPASPPGGPG